MVPHPDQFGKCEARQRGVRRNPDQVLISDLGRNLFALLGRPLITPDDGGTDHLVILIQHNQTVHLTTDTQRHNVFLIDAALEKHRMDRAYRSVVPVFRILFRPAVLRLIKRIFHRCRADAFTVLVKQYCLCTGCSQVDPKQVFHMHFPLYPLNIVVTH